MSCIEFGDPCSLACSRVEAIDILESLEGLKVATSRLVTRFGNDDRRPEWAVMQSIILIKRLEDSR
jgi:hypothetical protein